MDTELKVYLEAMERRSGDRMEAMENRMEAMERRIGDRMDALDAKIEKVETSLLTEFHKWASPTELRMRSHAAALRALDLEMEGPAVS